MSPSIRKSTWRDYLSPHVFVPLGTIALLGLFLMWALLPEGIYDYAPAFMKASNPLREPVWWPKKIFLKGYELTPMRHYVLDARMYGKHEYALTEDPAADLAPVDMYWGWGPMMDARLVDYLSVTIRQRGAYVDTILHDPKIDPWNVGIPFLHISRREKELYADNNHLIPSTPEIEQQLPMAPIGSLIHLEGYFVDVRNANGFRWTSNLTRGTDHPLRYTYSTGMNISCKVIYVTKFAVMS